MKAIVTGATGFLGQHLCQMLLQQGWQVIAFGRNLEKGRALSTDKLVFNAVDLKDFGQLDKVFEPVEAVFHCAALSSAWGNKHDFFQSNVSATENVVKCSVKHGVKKLVHVSTTSVYFDFRDRLGIKETDPLALSFVNEYARTKYLSERIVLADNDDAKLERVIIRPRGIIGDGDNAIMPRILRVANKGMFPLFNHGKALIDVTYVGNVADAMIRCVQTDNIDREIFNISNDEPLRIIDLLQRVFAVMDKQVKLRSFPYPLFMTLANILETCARLSGNGEPVVTKYGVGLLNYSQTLDINKAKSVLAYRPVYTLDEGIQRYAISQQ